MSVDPAPAGTESGVDCVERRTRALIWWLFGLYSIFVVYGSLVPLEFVARPLDDAIAAFRAIPFLRLGIRSRADWVANLLLFVPLGFLAAQVFLGDCGGARRLLGSAVLIALGCALAATIEFVQLFFPQRTVSQNDILAESVGGLVGVVLQAYLGGRATRFIGVLWAHESSQRRVVRLLHAYLLLLLLFNVLPLDLTISPVEIYHKWREGRVVLIPFGGDLGGVASTLYALATDALLWVPAGLLWARIGSASVMNIVSRGFVAAVAIEALQLFVYSRVTDVTDVLLAAAGAGLGGMIGLRGHRDPRPATRLQASGWLAIWLVWVALVLGVFWYPFGFTSVGVTGDTVLDAITRTPFSTYYFTSEFHATNEMLRRLLFFAPGGAAMGMLLLSLRSLRISRQAAVWGIASIAVVALVVEAGQLFLPAKVADPTDALLETTGSMIGLLLVKWLNQGGRPPADAVGALEPARPPAEPDVHRGFVVRQGMAGHVLAVAILAVLIGVLGALPAVPYNIRELIPPGLAGWGAALGLALVAYGIANAPFAIAAFLRDARFMLFPLVLAAHGLVTWAILRPSVPIESLHDILGTPVRDWPWEWELIGRYLALHIAGMLPILGAALFICVVLRPASLNYFLIWLIGSVMLAWPLHLVVVDRAATDNLTELMRDNGSLLSSTLLASGIFLAALTGSAFAAAIASTRRRITLAILGGAAALLAYWAFALGTEPFIVKYGRIFSAFQFLLSADRDQYASGAALLLRYVAAFAVMSGGLALLQLHSWKAWVRGGHRPGAVSRGAG